MGEVDWLSLHKILSDITRSILQLLAEKEALNYAETIALLQVTDKGRLDARYENVHMVGI